MKGTIYIDNEEIGFADFRIIDAISKPPSRWLALLLLVLDFEPSRF